MTIKRLAIISVHTGPLEQPGGKKVGGMNIYVRELSQELGRRGVEVDIFTRRNSPKDPEIDYSLGPNVRVIYLSAGPEQPMQPDNIYPYLSQFTARIIAFTTRHNIAYEMIYSHYWLSGWVANKLNEVWGTPFVHMFHTLGHMKKRIVSSGFYLPDVRINVETQITAWADRIIAATPAEEAQLRWLYRTKRRNISVVPPGVNTERFYPISSAEARQQLGFNENCHLLLFVGRIEPLKSVDTILNALRIIREQDPAALDEICLAVIGGDLDAVDDELARLQSLCCDLDLGCTVRFLGAKDQTTLQQYYAAATAVIMPSDYESFGMVALEAMATGTPVIASEVGGLAFLVRDNETGFLVPVREPKSLAESIKRLISDLNKSQEMGQTASQLAKNYAWPRIAEKLLLIFDEVLEDRSNRRKHSVYS